MTIDIIIVAGIFILAGIMHFVYPKPFVYIMPGWVPFPKTTNLVVGAIEIILGGMFLFDSLRSAAAWLIILLLIAVFPANIQHFLISKKRHKHMIGTALRLPLQFALIYWIWLYT